MEDESQKLGLLSLCAPLSLLLFALHTIHCCLLELVWPGHKDTRKEMSWDWSYIHMHGKKILVLFTKWRTEVKKVE